MGLNKSRVVQRVLNELSDEGVKVERCVVEKSVEKVMDTPNVVLGEDDVCRLVVSAITDGADVGVVGERVSDSGGILVSSTGDLV